ncbi:hypothetical protein ACGFS9_27115 [Streptomyces sp. NPDC048566]|uniref:hypothetical protein n=1 Tax=Streptomyces sp. NPDC048566 TaxID=3365569 RepID=UPI00371B7AD5
MRRTARVLYATALAGATLAGAASAASADPAAQVSPGSVEPGGTVTISVTCDGIAGTPPEAIDARSEGFTEGAVQLHRVEGAGPGAAGAAAYRGTAHVASGGPEGAKGPLGGGVSAPPAAGPVGSPEETAFRDGTRVAVLGPARTAGVDRTTSRVSAASDAENGDLPPEVPGSGGSDTVAPDAMAPPPVATDPEAPGSGYSNPAGPDGVPPDDAGPDAVGPDSVPEPPAPDTLPDDTLRDSTAPGSAVPDLPPAAPVAPEADGARGEWGVDGVCPAPPGGQGKRWTASYSVARGAPSHDPGTGTRPPSVQQGVQAGRGGAFTDSVPALVAGGLLVAGAACAAVHRLRHRRT